MLELQGQKKPYILHTQKEGVFGEILKTSQKAVL